jgi:hypothetical protein
MLYSARRVSVIPARRGEPLAGDPGGGVGGQKHGDAGDIVGSRAPKRRACLNGGEPIQIEEPEIVPPARTLDSQNALRLFVDSSSSIRRAFVEHSANVCSQRPRRAGDRNLHGGCNLVQSPRSGSRLDRRRGADLNPRPLVGREELRQGERRAGGTGTINGSSTSQESRP